MRLRIPSHRHDHGYFTRLVAALKAGPPVGEVRVNPTTASVLLADASADALQALLEHARTHGLFRLPDGGEVELMAAMLDEARRIDGGVRAMSGGGVNLRGLAFVALLGGALYQLARGELLAPASTLGWYAAALLALPGRGN